MSAIVLMTQTLPMIIATGVVIETIRRVMPRQGEGTGKAIAHWHYKGKNQAVKHSHPSGGISHRHKGLPGYGRKKSTLRR